VEPSDDVELVQAFLDESRENLDQVDLDLVALEENPADTERLARVFRAMHTVKGTCGFLGYFSLEKLTHAGENLLSAVRAGDLSLDAGVTTTLLRLVDAIRRMLDQIETTGADGNANHAGLIAAVEAHLSSPQEAAPVAEEASEPPEPEQVAAAGGVAGDSSVRVDVAVLDKLMDLVGELVQARNQIGDVVADDDEGPLALSYRQLRLATGELQDGVMRARLQPVGTVTGKFRRVVRDLAVSLGKQVHLEIDGEDVGVDKAVNEALAGPLLHLVRNAVDHGIEMPAERISAGKAAEGLLRIRAFHEGGRVHVEISDDGRGIDRRRLVDKAVSTGLLSSDRAAELSVREVFDLMFLPGLSTKSDVTSLSGRGVGLDVVRSSLEHVGGGVEVTSEPGRGCTFHLSVPLTLAIMPAVVTWCAGERYTIPQVDVEEVLHLDAGEAAGVQRIQGVGLHRLRGRLLPLVDLADTLGGQLSSEDADLTIVVVTTGGKRFGLVVDAVGDMTEAVVKPLPVAIRSVRAFGGVTILGDGRPSLILDVAGVAAIAGIVAGPAEGVDATAASGDRAHRSADADTPESVPANGEESLLVAIDDGGGRIAVRLRSVHRLEQFDASSVERIGATDVVPYDGAILPLLRFGMLDGRRVDQTLASRLPTVVCDSSVGLVGLVVRAIDDVVATPASPRGAPSRRGVSASLVLDAGVTEVVDLEVLIADAGLSPR
jgi:two-component system chemotaxis sensor kinase CheA